MSRSGRARHASGPGPGPGPGSGSGLSPVQLLVALLTLLGNCRTMGMSRGSETLLQDPYDVVRPTRVDARGRFLSNFLSHHARRVQRREASEGPADLDRVFYHFWHAGHALNFNLTLNPHLLSPGFLTERRYGGLEGAQLRPLGSSQCHFLGEVWDGPSVKGSAAISTCEGLTGLFRLSDEEFFIQPLEKSSKDAAVPQAHAVYRRHVSPLPWSSVVQTSSGKRAVNGSCGLQDADQNPDDVERQRERWEQRHQRRRRRIRQRSVSREKWVETLVVADTKMVEYHGSKAVEAYILAVMNIVAGLFRDASIGNAINIVVVRLILLEQEEDDLKVTHHADNSLSSFCKWQKKLNMKGDEHPLHHDVAVLLTRKDICAAVNLPCETLGLSHVAGMCQSHRSCSISEDTGLPLAFTVAHELGHNFGIQHDGNGNECEPVGKRPFVMSPHLLYGTFLPRWSRCSRQYITRFLDRGWGWCLDDAPAKDKLSVSSALPGVLYSAAHQCRLQYGSGSLLCDDMDDVCSTLWCTVGSTCHSKLDGAVDGTSCGDDKWCFSGECVARGLHPHSVAGGWGSWSAWSSCTRTCGAGVQSAQRDCDNPVPKYRGKYCLGERRRYKVCNVTPCPQELPTFRDVQCGHFNTLPHKGKFYQWESVINPVSPCELHCRPLNEHFSEKMLDAVADGTPCHAGNTSRDMCVNGICKKLGCDYVIDSGAVEDRCGVCHGNGSTCKTVKKTFEESEGLGYVDIGLIPEGAWDIRIEEVSEAGNFLALRSDNPNKYFLNGGWTIQWNGDYKAAGTVFTYLRTGHLENLTSPGPTMEPLWIQLLFQESNPGVRYEYTVSRNLSRDDATPLSEFFWKHGSWTECSVTCGTGVQRQMVHCVEKTTGIVDADFCDPLTRPDDNQTSCNRDACPATWWVGEWQTCSASCGSSGLARRTVMCVRAVSVDEQTALPPGDCDHIPRPDSLSSCNTHITCPADWTASSWSKCSLSCGSGVRRRNVTCSRNTGVDCDPLKKPLAVSTCYVQDCPLVVDNFGGSDWSGSGWPSKEVLNEINSIPEAKPAPKHGTTRAQPRTQPDPSTAVEGDFHYHNNIENIQHNKVQVDDFYYDYNFINFHEDLSDDFDNDEDESGDIHAATPPASDSGFTRSTRAPTAAVSTTSDQTENGEEEPREATPHDVKHRGNAATTTTKSLQTDFDTTDDFLSEDFLLPVSVTHSPPLSTSQRTQKPQHDNESSPQATNTKPRLEATTKAPTQDGTRGRYEAGTENSDDYFGEVEVEVTAGPTPTRQTASGSVVTTALSDRYDESPDSHSQETVIQVDGQVPQDERPSEIPQTSSQSTVFPTPFMLDDSQLEDLVYETGEDHLWDSDRDLSATSQTSTPPAAPSLLLSGNREASEDATPSAGAEIKPPTNPEGATPPFPRRFLPAQMENPSAAPALVETTGTESTSAAPPAGSDEYDYNEIVLPPVVRSRGRADPTHHLPPPTPTAGTRLAPAPTRTTSAHWLSGNWSSCSTSCGLGAVWRTLTCSTGSDSDCDPAKRPAPAQRCYLRPCATWRVGEWSKCSRDCGAGVRSRDVQCFDTRDQRPLRPFHCRAVTSRPPTQAPCDLQPCLSWYTSSWGQCSEVCGGGEQQRIVTCPEEDRCDRDLQPSNIQSCNSQPCVQWLTGSWGQCSASCGGGVQHRLIKCVNTKAEADEDVDQEQCSQEPQPERTRKCHVQECQSAPSGAVCIRDRLTLRFCQTLRLLGRCQLANVRAQCCKACSRSPHHGGGGASRH